MTKKTRIAKNKQKKYFDIIVGHLNTTTLQESNENAW